MDKPTKPNLRPYYRVSDLVELTETSRGRVLRLLGRVGVKPQWVGGMQLVFVSDIAERMPELWRSLVMCERARAMARAVADRESTP